ncbi:DUF2322 family protein [Acidithiobacillus sp. 'AMD consortium']|uniref:Uncharacterized protein n=2 Tax=Acidithiobacillus ferridurans TaxID=1232575 RepID=A0A2Z6IK05_ACIFI|nr:MULTISPECIES: DUF2322 family protein [Acidithiobacillus]MBU2716038.1 DUF2322 family protein [Acidithiobacillus ferridurans]MBU2722856.1 DUF2322 family protein [Acidithiobacillus ferridurans]MBU2804277.1 DUF2322 family protein [Acidithiobacillus ferridurans]QFG77397.1 DUF2322 family protein [Acidithiobacillus sp. 'AMD consortium']RBM02379.1 hypothetical protein C3R74_05515 [Acidithiobacillus ferridurans]
MSTTTLPNIDHVRKLLLYGGPLAQLQGELVKQPDQEISIAVLYQLALRHGVISPTAAREGLALLAAVGPAGAAGRAILERVLTEGDFLAVRVMR